MTDNTPILLTAAALIGLIGLAIGAAIGFIIASMRASPSSGGSERKGLDELARLWKNPRSGQISVEIQGKLIATAAGLNAAQRTDLTHVHDELQGWLGLDNSAARSSVPAASPAPGPSQRVIPPVGQASSTLLERTTKAGDQDAPKGPLLPQIATQTYNVRPPSLQLGDILSTALNPVEKAKEGPEEPTTIAGQVDAIIQARLPISPLRERMVKLLDGADSGIVVWVDGQKFNSIADVDDTEVRVFIQSCIAEWDKKYGK